MRNVIYIVADDLSRETLGYAGNVDALTPHIDALAAKSSDVVNAFAHPVCTPTRAGMMTGIYPHHYGLADDVIRPWHTHGVPTNIKLLPEYMREIGYKTALVGKWHLGHGSQALLPHNRGFDHSLCMYVGATDYWAHSWLGEHDLHRDGQTVHYDGEYLTDVLGREAASVISGHNFYKPLFLMFTPNAPHLPRQAKPDDETLFSGITDEDKRVFLAQLYSLDRQVGRIIDALEQRGQIDNSLIVFTSDNGGLGEGKGTLNGVNVPMIVRHPYIVPGKSGAVVHTMDLFASALHEAALPLSSNLHKPVQLTLSGAQRNWCVVHIDSISACCITRGVKYALNPQRSYLRDAVELNVTNVTGTPIAPSDVDWVWFDQWIDTKVPQGLAPPLALPTDPKQLDFAPPHNWEPVN